MASRRTPRTACPARRGVAGSRVVRRRRGAWLARWGAWRCCGRSAHLRFARHLVAVQAARAVQELQCALVLLSPVRAVAVHGVRGGRVRRREAARGELRTGADLELCTVSRASPENRHPLKTQTQGADPVCTPIGPTNHGACGERSRRRVGVAAGRAAADARAAAVLQAAHEAVRGGAGARPPARLTRPEARRTVARLNFATVAPHPPSSSRRSSWPRWTRSRRSAASSTRPSGACARTSRRASSTCSPQRFTRAWGRPLRLSVGPARPW